MSRLTLCAFMLSGLAGCATSPTVQQEATAPGLTLNEAAGVVSGTYSSGADKLVFGAKLLEPGVVDAWVDIGGKTLTVLAHPDAAAADYDGFATADGSTTALNDSARELLQQFGVEISERSGDVDFTPLDVLKRAAGWWSQTNDAQKLQVEVLSDPNHGWSSLCGSVYNYVWGTHDCYAGGNWTPQTQRLAQIAYRYDNATALYCWGGGWTSAWHGEHSANYGPKFTGGCWGHCGAGCPGSSNNEVNTQDCLNHDECTTMHGTTTGDCNNEFSNSSDDFLFASSCGGTKLADQAYHAIGACP
ncbi:MAG: putative lipoprotein [Myxococcales bacterium]|nr:putative lipoprotein [Myxococcales bacterium]